MNTIIKFSQKLKVIHVYFIVKQRQTWGKRTYCDKIKEYLVDGTCSLVTMHMAIYSKINLIFLPETLKALTAHWF